MYHNIKSNGDHNMDAASLMSTATQLWCLISHVSIHCIQIAVRIIDAIHLYLSFVSIGKITIFAIYYSFFLLFFCSSSTKNALRNMNTLYKNALHLTKSAGLISRMQHLQKGFRVKHLGVGWLAPFCVFELESHASLQIAWNALESWNDDSNMPLHSACNFQTVTFRSSILDTGKI